MVAGGLPSYQVLLDDGTGTFPYDITAYVRLVQGWSIQRGRQDELAAVTPGSLSLTLDNADGRFTIGSTLIASPSPIKVDARIRVKETANGTTFTRGTGYVVSWPVDWPSGDDGFSTVKVTATDAQARAERWTLAPFAKQDFAANSPSAYWALDDQANALSSPESLGHSWSPLVPTLGVSSNAWLTAPVFGRQLAGIPCVLFGQGQTLSQSDLAYTTTTPAFVCAFNTTNTFAGASCMFTTPDSQIYVDMVAGKLKAGGSAYFNNGATYNDGNWHVLALRWTGTYASVDVYIDAVLTDPGYATAIPTVPTPGLIVGGTDSGGGTVNWTGSLAHMGVWFNAPAGSVMVDVSKAILGKLASESGVARITRVAGYLGLSTSTLDSSMTTMPDQDGSSIAGWEAITNAADAEFGLAYIDGTGGVAFHNRNRVAGKTTPDVTVDANFLDPGTSFVTDMQGVLNYYQVTAAGTGNTQLVRDATSESNHGRYSGSASYQVLTDAEAFYRGSWVIATHKEPGPRVGSLVFDLLTMTAAQQAQMLAIEPDTWVQIINLPSQTPGGATVDFVVQGFTEDLKAETWTLTVNAVSKAVVYPACWVLGNTNNSVLGSTTRLYM